MDVPVFPKQMIISFDFHSEDNQKPLSCTRIELPQSVLKNIFQKQVQSLCNEHPNLLLPLDLLYMILQSISARTGLWEFDSFSEVDSGQILASRQLGRLENPSLCRFFLTQLLELVDAHEIQNIQAYGSDDLESNESWRFIDGQIVYKSKEKKWSCILALYRGARDPIIVHGVKPQAADIWSWYDVRTDKNVKKIPILKGNGSEEQKLFLMESYLGACISAWLEKHAPIYNIDSPQTNWSIEWSSSGGICAFFVPVDEPTFIRLQDYLKDIWSVYWYPKETMVQTKEQRWDVNRFITHAKEHKKSQKEFHKLQSLCGKPDQVLVSKKNYNTL